MAHATRPRTLDPENLTALEAWLTRAVDADAARIETAELLPGGAVGENWRLQVAVTGGARAGRHEWALRTDAYSRIPMSLDRAQEFACLKAAHGAGVTVPEPIADCGDPDVIGASFMIVGYVSGIAQARKIVRDPDIGSYGDALAERLGAELARLHGVRPPRRDLDFLQVPDRPAGRAQVADMRRSLDSVSTPRPALEYVLAWLDDNAPGSGPLVLCHGDFRTGNYMVEGGRLTGLLDWEFTHWGDAREDLGWFCARSWRFGQDAREAGGIADRAALYRGYNAVAAEPLDPADLAYWEILAAARWAVIALLQGERHISGQEDSLELMLTGLMAPEMEYDALTDIMALDRQERRVAHG